MGVDIAEPALALARETCRNFVGVRTRIMSVEELAADPPSADMVFSNVCLQHNDDAMFADAAALIKSTHPRRLWMHEQSDPTQATTGCWGRSLERFRASFPDHDLTETDRIAGPDGRWHSVFSGVRRATMTSRVPRK